MALRISKDADDSTSIERQQGDCTSEVARMGASLVASVTDPDVSARKTTPFERPELGPYLTDPVLAASYDLIVWQRLDRAVRSMRDMHELAAWSLNNRKKLLFVQGPGGNPLLLDFSNGPLDPIAELMLTLFAFAAQIESQSISERTKGLASYLRNNARWVGGNIPYGYKPIDNPDGDGKILVPDEHSSEILREIIARAIDGETPEAICRSLDSRGVPTPKNYQRKLLGKPMELTTKAGRPVKWNPSSLRTELLRNRSILGETTVFVRDEKGKIRKDDNGKLMKQTVRDSNGMPILRAEPLVSLEDWEKLQAVLDGRAKSQAPRRRDANPYLGILKCPACGRNQHHRGWHDAAGRKYAYFYCPDKCFPALSTNHLDPIVSGALLDSFGDLEVFEKRYVPGEDHSQELTQVRSAIDSLADEKDAGLHDHDLDRYMKRMTRLVEREKTLMALPSRPAGFEWIPSGRTYREAWETSSVDERRQLLLDAGVSVFAAKPKDDQDQAKIIDTIMRTQARERGIIAMTPKVAAVFLFSHEIEARLTNNADWTPPAQPPKASLRRHATKG